VLLIAEGLTKTHDGERMLFSNLNFTISAGDKLAIVGPNGAGAGGGAGAAGRGGRGGVCPSRDGAQQVVCRGAGSLQPSS
jgi:hypothetical protein